MSTCPGHHLPTKTQAYLIYGIQNPVSIVPRDNLAIAEEGQLAQGPSSGLQKARLSGITTQCCCMLSHSVSIALVHLSQETEIMSPSYQTRTLPTVGIGTKSKSFDFSLKKWLATATYISLNLLNKTSEATKQFDYKLEDWEKHF